MLNNKDFATIREVLFINMVVYMALDSRVDSGFLSGSPLFSQELDVKDWLDDTACTAQSLSHGDDFSLVESGVSLPERASETAPSTPCVTPGSGCSEPEATPPSCDITDQVTPPSISLIPPPLSISEQCPCPPRSALLSALWRPSPDCQPDQPKSVSVLSKMSTRVEAPRSAPETVRWGAPPKTVSVLDEVPRSVGEQRGVSDTQTRDRSSSILPLRCRGICKKRPSRPLVQSSRSESFDLGTSSIPLLLQSPLLSGVLPSQDMIPGQVRWRTPQEHEAIAKRYMKDTVPPQRGQTGVVSHDERVCRRPNDRINVQACLGTSDNLVGRPLPPVLSSFVYKIERTIKELIVRKGSSDDEISTWRNRCAPALETIKKGIDTKEDEESIIQKLIQNSPPGFKGVVEYMISTSRPVTTK